MLHVRMIKNNNLSEGYVLEGLRKPGQTTIPEIQLVELQLKVPQWSLMYSFCSLILFQFR
jgi:hypothetical protein